MDEYHDLASAPLVGINCHSQNQIIKIYKVGCAYTAGLGQIYAMGVALSLLLSLFNIWNMNKITPEFKKSLLFSFFEYIVILSPIAIYVYLEAVHNHDWRFFYRSPEWAIGIIFLSFISINKYVQTCYNSYKSALSESLNIYSLFNIIIIVLATLNAVWSIEEDNDMLKICRFILFALASFIFFIFMTNSKLIRNDN